MVIYKTDFSLSEASYASGVSSF